MQIKKIKIEQPENEDLEQYVPATARTSCWTRGFIALLITQFTVALNDNIFRWLIIPIGKHYINEDTARLLGGVFLVVPFIMFASMAGFMTDRFSRRSVMIWCKFVEIMLLLLGISVICFLPLSGVVKVTALLVVLFLLGTQATFFSPSKYGVIPDLVPQNQISNANGYLAMLTMIAIVAGQIIGGYLFAWTTLFKEIEEGGHKIKVIVGEPGTQNWFLTTSVLLGFALIGYVSSFFIPKFKPSASHVKFEKNIFKQTVTELRMLIAIRPLFYAALASSFFWGLAALSQTNIDKYACDFLMVKQEHVTPLAAILSFGIAGGSLLAGWLSRGRIELGMVPIGAFGMGIFAIFIGFTPPLPETVKAGFGTITSHSYLYGSIGLMLLGLMAGLYDVPLAAFLQKESPLEKRGRILAAYNFFSFSFMLAFSVFCFGLAMLFNTLPYTKAAASLWIWITIGILVIVVGVVMLRYLMLQFLEFIVRTFFRLVYRVEIRGEENIPREGGVLIVSNHVSFLDGLLLYAFCTRPVRYFAHDDYIKGFAANYVARKTGVMRIVPGKKSVIDAIKQAREALSKGEIVGIFPEGGLTRTGQIREFEPGYTSFLKGNEHVPILPVFIGGLFGSVFSYADRSRGFFSWPRRLRSQVVLEFGKPLPGDTPVHVLKHAVDEMAADSIKREQGKAFLPPCQWLRTFKKHRFSKYVQFADTLGTELSPRNFMISALVARRILRREVLARDVKKVAELKPMKGFWAYFNPIQYVFWRMLVVCHLARKIVVQREQNVAILTPPSVAGAIVNAALTLDCRTTTNLNYTFTADLLNFCLGQLETKHVLTSRKVLERFDFRLNAEVVCIEDIIKKVTIWDKIVAVCQAFLIPAWLLDRCFGLNRLSPDDVMTVIYTSGSTGRPKGAMLSYRAISENINGFQCIVHLGKEDNLLGVLPFFHSFGYTVAIWVPQLLNVKVAYHYTPLEPKKIGELSVKYGCNIFVATATFMRTYLKKCKRGDFAEVKTVIAGAEKLPKDVMDAWEEKFGVRPVEGYGTTELSPVVGTNIPPVRKHDDYQPGLREGSVGRPLPFVAAKIVDVETVNAETWEELPPDTPGMLVIKGANVMNGYYKEPDLTEKVLRDGWYVTGDIAKIDKDGFIFITGRESRISKIGGEMVPHIMIEEMLLEILQKQNAVTQENDDDKTCLPLAVSALPDPKKGERIIVLYTELLVTPETLCREMVAMGCPNIWVPSPNNFYQVAEIPVLATGKLDLASLRTMVKSLQEKEETSG